MSANGVGTFSFIREILLTAIATFFKKPYEKKLHKAEFRLRISIKAKCKQIIYLCFFMYNVKKIFNVYQLLSDNHSKELFKKLLLFRIVGLRRIKIKEELDWKNEENLLDSIQKFYYGASNLDLFAHPSFGPLNHYKNIPTETDDIVLDSWAYSLVYVALKKQYYFEYGDIKVKPEKGDVVIDAGGCLGDNAVYFAKSVGEHGHVHVFDPLPTHEKIIKKNIIQNQLSNRITYSSYALGNKSSRVIKNNDITYSSLPPDPTFHIVENTELLVITIDDFVRNNNLNKIDFIKMDIEGDEMLALQGAINTIKQFKPKLAISIYHKWKDFYAIPLWIHEIFDDYHFFIDHYTPHSGETILYAIAK